MTLLLVIGALAAIFNLLLNIVSTYLAIRRTNMQADLHRWKCDYIRKQKTIECGDPKHKEI